MPLPLSQCSKPYLPYQSKGFSLSKFQSFGSPTICIIFADCRTTFEDFTFCMEFSIFLFDDIT